MVSPRVSPAWAVGSTPLRLRDGSRAAYALGANAWPACAWKAFDKTSSPVRTQTPLVQRQRGQVSCRASDSGVASTSGRQQGSHEQQRNLPRSTLPELLAVLSDHHVERSSLPIELNNALASEDLPVNILERYLTLHEGPLAPLMGIRGFRDRLLADPSFIVKVAIEVGIGIFTKTSAEYTKRGAQFGAELDFVFANILMALVADFMLVWLPAPTLAFGSGMTQQHNTVLAFFASCPDNAFQSVSPGQRPFTLAQRGGAIVRNGAKLLAVGCTASLIGVGITNGLILVRQGLDPSWAPPNGPQDVLALSLAYGSYMAVSSNLRYQLIAGVVEQRGIEVLFASQPRICNLLSFVVRTSNTFVGSLWWVDYIHLLGFQSSVHAH